MIKKKMKIKKIMKIYNKRQNKRKKHMIYKQRKYKQKKKKHKQNKLSLQIMIK